MVRIRGHSPDSARLQHAEGARLRHGARADRRALAIAAALERHLQTFPELTRPTPDPNGLTDSPAC
jgi:hypothetical protein